MIAIAYSSPSEEKHFFAQLLSRKVECTMRLFIDAVVRVLVNGLAISLTALALPGMRIVQHDVSTFIVLGVVIGVINGLVKPIINFISFPINFLTLGLFHLVINALLLELVSKIVPNLQIDNFFIALVGGIILGILATVLEAIARQFEPRGQSAARA